LRKTIDTGARQRTLLVSRTEPKVDKPGRVKASISLRPCQFNAVHHLSIAMGHQNMSVLFRAAIDEYLAKPENQQLISTTDQLA
jgi:hypothetical protein